jgi:hypothetical protein
LCVRAKTEKTAAEFVVTIRVVDILTYSSVVVVPSVDMPTGYTLGNDLVVGECT